MPLIAVPWNEKLADLMHYIIWKCHDPTTLGAVKLNKTLFYADLFAYLDLGHAITDVTYIKRQYGPVPDPPAFFAARDVLQEMGKIAITHDLYHGMPQYQFVALQRPNLSSFTAEEVSLIDLVIEEICFQHTASFISAQTHDIIWHAAAIGEVIPLATVFASRIGELTEEDMHWARTEAARLGLGA